MLTAEIVFDTGRFSYADAEHLADLWNRAYPAMRKVSTGYIEGMRKYIEREGWVIDPNHRYADVLQEQATPEKKARRKLRTAEELRRQLGQLDRGTHKLCTRSPGSFSVTGSYMAVRHLLGISSFSSEGLADVYRLAAVLAEAEEKLNVDRAAWHRENSSN